MKKENQIDIFDLLAAIDKRDMGFLDRQTPEMKKTFSPFVALRWASAVRGAETENYIWLVNELANADFQALYDYPDLQYRLLALCGAGKVQNHQWIPPQKKSKTVSKVHDFIADFHPLANSLEIDILVNQHTKESFTVFVNGSGCTPEEAKNLIKAFEKYLKEKS